MKRFLLLPVLAAAATAAVAAPPAAPTDVVAFAPGVGMPQVIWNDNSSDEEKFEVQIFVVGESEPAASSQVGLNIQTERFSGGAGSSVKFRVRAVRGVEASAWVESQNLAVPSVNFAFGSLTPNQQGGEDFQYAPDGFAGIEGDAFEHTVPRVGSATPTDFFLEGFPDGCAIDSTGKITGTLPPMGIAPRAFYGAIAGGETFKQAFFLRSESAETTPQLRDPIAPSLIVGRSSAIDLNTAFRNPEFPAKVRFNTTLGTFDAVLFDEATPQTVANFLRYLRSGAYTSSVAHRSVADFIVQAGGFNQLASRTTADWKPVTTATPVRNEPGFSNVRGTIAMAKLGGNPDSATSQWFVNTGATNASNLDFQNGGFTVFGKVLGSGMAVVDAINDLPTGNYNIRLQGAGTQSFQGVPANSGTAPATLTPAQEVAIQSVEELPTLTFSLVSNSAPGVVSASVAGQKLNLTGIAVGTSTIVLKATDAEAEFVEGTFDVTVTAAPPPPPPRDTTRPTAQISAPPSRGQYPSSGKLRVQGSAKDNVGLAKWQYRLNGSSWKSGGTLSGTSKKFAKTVGRFKRGRNKLQLRSFDRAGNVSSTDSKTITLK